MAKWSEVKWSWSNKYNLGSPWRGWAAAISDKSDWLIAKWHEPAGARAEYLITPDTTLSVCHLTVSTPVGYSYQPDLGHLVSSCWIDSPWVLSCPTRTNIEAKCCMTHYFSNKDQHLLGFILFSHYTDIMWPTWSDNPEYFNNSQPYNQPETDQVFFYWNRTLMLPSPECKVM